MNIEKKYMQRAIELAGKGIGFTNPNPLVGAVIVKDGRIIGEGYHERYGELHAERNAIAALSESAEGADIYVTLEPCCHYGKTPPCTEAIIENKIARVIIGSRDPNHKVAGKGAQILRAAGIEVIEDYMRDECDKLNPVFFHYIMTNTPYVVMKYAMTADGKIATKNGASKWITGEVSRNYVQQMRSEYMGIMVGINTVLADDPMLNVRLEGKRNPIRIICDTNLRIPLDSKLCTTANEYPLIVACSEAAAASNTEKVNILESMNVKVLSIENGAENRAGEDEIDKNAVKESFAGIDLKKLMKELGAMKIDSILLEGGGTLNESALRAGIVNEVKAFVAPKIFGGSAKSPVDGMGVNVPDEAHKMKLKDIEKMGDDILLSYIL